MAETQRTPRDEAEAAGSNSGDFTTLQHTSIDEWLQQNEAGPSAWRPVAPRRQKSEPSAPPRPSNAWILYRADIMRALETDTLTPRQQEVRDRVRQEIAVTTPATSNRSGQQLGNISRIASAMWRAEDATVRNTYTLRSEDVRQRHREMYPDYKFKPRRRQTMGREGADSAAQSASRSVSTQYKGRQAESDTRMMLMPDGKQDTAWTSASSTSSGDYDKQAWVNVSPGVDLAMEGSSVRHRSHSSPLRIAQDASTIKDMRAAIPIMIPELSLRPHSGHHMPSTGPHYQQMPALHQYTAPSMSTELGRDVTQGSRAHPFLPPRGLVDAPSLPLAHYSAASISGSTSAGPTTGPGTTVSDFEAMSSPQPDWTQSRDSNRGWSSAGADTQIASSTAFGPNALGVQPHGGEMYSMSAPAWQAHFPRDQTGADASFAPMASTPSWRTLHTGEGPPQHALRSHMYASEYVVPAETRYFGENLESHSRELSQASGLTMSQGGSHNMSQSYQQTLEPAEYSQGGYDPQQQQQSSWAMSQTQQGGMRGHENQDRPMAPTFRPVRYDVIPPTQSGAASHPLQEDIRAELSDEEVLRKLYDQETPR